MSSMNSYATLTPDQSPPSMPASAVARPPMNSDRILTLHPRAIRRHLAGRGLPIRLVVLDRTGSTNDVARRAGDRGAPAGLVNLADEQTAGRGRRGRAWQSPPGRNLFLSLLLRPDLAAADAFLV